MASQIGPDNALVYTNPTFVVEKLDFISVYNVSNVTIPSSGSGNIIFTGSIIGPAPIGYYKSVLILLQSGSTNLVTTAAICYLDWSYDGITWHGTYTGSIPTGTTLTGLIPGSIPLGVITATGNWNLYQINQTLPYMRILINNTGSALSGSYALIGYPYT
jgi:hypothetical protein